MPTERELDLLRDTVRVERFQFLIEDVGEFRKARAIRVKFVVPGTHLRRQRTLAVYESDVGLSGQRCQHSRELLQHGRDDLLARRERCKRWKIAQVEGRLEPWTKAANPPTVRNREVVPLEHQAGTGTQPVSQRDQVFVSGAHQRQRAVETRLVDKFGRRYGWIPVLDP